MRQNSAVLKSLAIGWLGLSVGVVPAADYVWSGGGTDDNWTTTANWGSTAFPGLAWDIATVTAADTVNLDTNGIVTIGRLQLTSTTPKTVTVTGGAGAGFTFSGPAAPDSGIRVSGNAGNRLVFAPDIVIPTRIDRMGPGAVEFTGTQTGSAGAGVFGWVFGQGLNVFSGNSSLTLADAMVGIGNAGFTSTMILTNQAAWNVRNLYLGVATTVNSIGVMSQDSDESSVTVPGQLIVGQMVPGNTNGYYYLRKGTLTANAMTVGAGSPGRFEQSGGTQTVQSVTLWRGEYLQTDGQASLPSIVVGNGTTTPAFTLEGGELTVPTGLTINSGSFRQTGGQSYLRGVVTNKAPSLASAITLAGGTMTLDANFVIMGDSAKQVFNLSGGTLRVTNALSCAVPVCVNGAATLDTPVAGKTFTLSTRLFGDGQLVKTGAGSLFIGNGTTNSFSGGLVISNGVVSVGTNTLLNSYGGTTNALKVTVCNGGVLMISCVSSIVSLPLDLDIKTGGKIRFFNNGSTSGTRTLLIARSFSTNGVALPAGKKYIRTSSLTNFLESSDSVILVPTAWTGAGDGVSWNSGANWAGGSVPNGTTAAVDLTAAGDEIVLGSAVTVTGFAYSPQSGKRELTLKGAGSLSLYAGAAAEPCGFVGPGCSLVLDVPLYRASAANTWAAITGYGTVVIRKGYQNSTAPTANAPFSINGTFLFAGTMTLANTLGAFTQEQMGFGTVAFGAGCNLTCSSIANAPPWFPAKQYLHDGGIVTCDALYFTRAVGAVGMPTYATYLMRSGTLTVKGATGIGLGITGMGATVYGGGIFQMTGGTVTTTCFRVEQPTSQLLLQGGEIFLGSGGITSSVAAKGTVSLGSATLHATAPWVSSLPLTLAALNGSTTVIDTGSYGVTLNGALSGSGWLTKTGPGTLYLNGTNTFTGRLTVDGGTVTCGGASQLNGVTEITATNGTVVVNGTVGVTGLTLRLAGTGSLTLPAGAELTVARLYTNGVLLAAGSYAFGDATVTVSANTQAVWTGAANDGNLWSTTNNWGNTDAPPVNTSLDFGFSALAANAQIVLDVAPGVTLTNLTYDHGVSGSTLTLTCPAGTTNTLTFPANGQIRVAAGQTLVLDTDVFLSGRLYKYGTGTLVLNRHTYAPVTGSWASDYLNRITVMEGLVIGRGEISGIRVHPASPLALAALPEFILEGDRAIIHNGSITMPGYENQKGDKGVITQTGGTVDLTELATEFKSAATGFIMASSSDSTKINEGFYNLEAGTLIACSNYPSYVSANYSRGAVNQSGGTSTFFGLRLTQFAITARFGELNLSGGRLNLSGKVEKGWGDGAVNLSGGQVASLLAGDVFGADVPVTLATGGAGDVAFAQAQAAQTNSLPCALAGDGGLVQEGPGTLALNGVNAFGGNVTVKGGTLLVSAALERTQELFVDGGQLELLAEAPALTNLSVRAAGTAVRIDGAAVPFTSGLTLSLAQGMVTELDFDGIVDVDRLVLGGMAKSPGLYGGTDSAAPVSPLNAYFTGTGTLRVLYGPPPRGTMMMLR